MQVVAFLEIPAELAGQQAGDRTRVRRRRRGSSPDRPRTGHPHPGGSGEPSFAIGVSIVHPTGSVDERDTILTALRSAADSLTRPRLLTAWRVDDMAAEVPRSIPDRRCPRQKSGGQEVRRSGKRID